MISARDAEKFEQDLRREQQREAQRAARKTTAKQVAAQERRTLQARQRAAEKRQRQKQTSQELDEDARVIDEMLPTKMPRAPKKYHRGIDMTMSPAALAYRQRRKEMARVRDELDAMRTVLDRLK
jgi:predicted 2-oxoglutarate/Fe(II)-dependent dioxygenase YbiX